MRILGRLSDLPAMEERTLEDGPQVWRVFRANRDGICCKQVPTALRLRCLNAVVRTSMMSGLVATDPTAACLDALRHLHDNMIRRAVGLFKEEQMTWPERRRRRTVETRFQAKQEPWDRA